MSRSHILWIGKKHIFWKIHPSDLLHGNFHCWAARNLNAAAARDPTPSVAAGSRVHKLLAFTEDSSWGSQRASSFFSSETKGSHTTPFVSDVFVCFFQFGWTAQNPFFREKKNSGEFVYPEKKQTFWNTSEKIMAMNLCTGSFADGEGGQGKILRKFQISNKCNHPT